MQKNDFFKLGVFILGCIFLFIYYEKSQIGRYQFDSNRPSTVIDTKTGKIYDIKGNLKSEPQE